MAVLWLEARFTVGSVAGGLSAEGERFIEATCACRRFCICVPVELVSESVLLTAPGTASECAPGCALCDDAATPAAPDAPTAAPDRPGP